jgi:flagellar protein FliS
VEKPHNKFVVSSAINQYRTTANSSIDFENSHSLILRLMDGAIDRIVQAKFAIKQDDLQGKGELIGKAISIVGSLDACLDSEQQNELVSNLEAIYDYMNRRLLEASIEGNIEKLDEVSGLMDQIRSGWMQIPQELRTSTPEESSR